MKILQINVCCGIGSTGRICADVAALAQQKGHTCKVAYGRDAVPPKYAEYAVKIGNTPSVLWDGVVTRVTDNAGFNSVRATKQFIKWVKAYDPDIIHLHNIHGYFVNIKQLFDYLKECQKPVVWTLHDCWSFTGHCAHFDLVGCDKWKTACAHCPQKTEYPKSLLLDRSAKNYAAKKKLFTSVKDMTIVTPSNWLASLVGQSFLQKYPIKVLPNGIDTSVFKPTEGDFRGKYNCEDKYILLGVAFGWGEKKGLDAFIDLAKRLDERFQIVLVGTNDAVDKQLPSNVISIHTTNDQSELAQIYSAADLFVNLSREETYPTVNMEALSCATPVLTFETGGSPEMIDDTCGSVVEKNNIDALYEEILRIFNEKPFSKQACLVKAKQFDMNHRFLEYVQLYEQIYTKGEN